MHTWKITWWRFERGEEGSPAFARQPEMPALGKRFLGASQCALQDKLTDRAICRGSGGIQCLFGCHGQSEIELLGAIHLRGH